ncbi:Uncharacterized protein SCF082_LOCUS1988 [Durusdinium trenchii]|uniref:Ion transport domain-containing protein n=2 Tax=Durusdinium trenchii TaxID=1381693 RepID=A0ABP0HHY7_9DINO
MFRCPLRSVQDRIDRTFAGGFWDSTPWPGDVRPRLEAKEEEWIQDMNILLSAFQMIRVIRVLFWHQWRNEVQVVIDGIASAGHRWVPAFLSFYIWIMVSALFLWMENVYDGPSKEFFTSISTTMYWTSSFLIGEWTLADFSEGGGNRVCIFVVLFGSGS